MVDPGPLLARLDRATMTLSCGRCGVVVDLMEPTVTAFQCPDCGAWQGIETHPEQPDEDDFI